MWCMKVMDWVFTEDRKGRGGTCRKDYMKIEYRDGGNLYILATGFDAIQKYASADAKSRS